MIGKRDKQLMRYLEQVERGELSIEDLRASHPDAAMELEQLLEAADRIREIPPAAPGEAFRAAARRRILNKGAAARYASPGKFFLQQDSKQALARRLSRALAAAAILVAVYLSGGAVSFLAQYSLPGDALYPLKLQLEQVQLAFAPDTADAILEIGFASSRLTEIQLLVAAERYDDVQAGADAFQDSIDRAMLALTGVARTDSSKTYALLVHMEGHLQEYAAALEDLLVLVPGDTRAALAQAIAASQALSLQQD